MKLSLHLDLNGSLEERAQEHAEAQKFLDLLSDFTGTVEISEVEGGAGTKPKRQRASRKTNAPEAAATNTANGATAAAQTVVAAPLAPGASAFNFANLGAEAGAPIEVAKPAQATVIPIPAAQPAPFNFAAPTAPVAPAEITLDALQEQIGKTAQMGGVYLAKLKEMFAIMRVSTADQIPKPAYEQVYQQLTLIQTDKA